MCLSLFAPHHLLFDSFFRFRSHRKWSLSSLVSTLSNNGFIRQTSPLFKSVRLSILYVSAGWEGAQCACAVFFLSPFEYSKYDEPRDDKEEGDIGGKKDIASEIKLSESLEVSRSLTD